jgi:ribonuclease Z
MEITFLGTSTSTPTKLRGHPAIHVKFLNHNFLWDCGEGTQRQLTIAGISPFRIDQVFITHLHGDHILGLGGLIQTLAILGRKEQLSVLGPKGVKRYVDFFADPENYFFMEYKIEVKEVKEGIVYEGEDFKMRAFKAEHKQCPNYGYVFEEKVMVNLDKTKLRKIGLEGRLECRELKENGKITWRGKTVSLESVSSPIRDGMKVVYTGDSIPCEEIIEAAKDADLLISEATMSEEMKEKAHEYGHMTAKDAARIAKKAGVKKLILTHISPRYDDDPKVLEKEAREIFRNTDIANDFMKISL